MSSLLVLGQSSHATLVFPLKGALLGRIAPASAGADFVREMLAAALRGTSDVTLAPGDWTETDTIVRFNTKKLPDDKGQRVTIEYKETYDFLPLAPPEKSGGAATTDASELPQPSGLVWVIESDPATEVAPEIPPGPPLLLATSILPLAEHHTRTPEENGDARLWKGILTRIKARAAKDTFLVTSADAFRRAGYRTREEGSMSATVEDICATVAGSDTETGNPTGRPEFACFADIFVRLRGDGVLHLERDTEQERWIGTLYYTRESNVDSWTQHRGRHYGVDALLTACVARWAAAPREDRARRETILKEAVARIWLLVAKGSVMPQRGWEFAKWAVELWRWTTPPAEEPAPGVCPAATASDKSPCAVAREKQPTCTVENIAVTLALTRERNRWSLLEECIRQLPVPPADAWPFGLPRKRENRLAAQTQLYARHVAGEGYETSWGKKKKDREKKGNASATENEIPAIKYFELGKLKTVDRTEVEGLSGLKRLINAYPAHLALLDGKPETPLCLAVFGAPGSGKSFGVKEIAKSLAKQSDAAAGTFQISKNILEFNVSQFTELGDLANAMQDIREERLAGKIPVVIFDEFDSSFNGQGFGWLKYFLMPMQDGKFRDEQTDYRTGGCIMVFAGGINHNFAEFTGRQRDKEFATAKGPDFISRLRGVHNIPSMTRDDAQRFPLWQIRRAGLLHNYLETKDAKISDVRLLDALLTVGRFHHGARSLEAIIQMCDKNAQGQIDLTSLPRREQLDLHVDANEFWSLIMAQGPEGGAKKEELAKAQ